MMSVCGEFKSPKWIIFRVESKLLFGWAWVKCVSWGVENGSQTDLETNFRCQLSPDGLAKGGGGKLPSSTFHKPPQYHPYYYTRIDGQREFFFFRNHPWLRLLFFSLSLPFRASRISWTRQKHRRSCLHFSLCNNRKRIDLRDYLILYENFYLIIRESRNSGGRKSILENHNGTAWLS
jgi:hypothetical protein